MATHVSVRLFWHDSGWNGSICRDPLSNVWCEAHENVRDHKDVSAEVACLYDLAEARVIAVTGKSYPTGD